MQGTARAPQPPTNPPIGHQMSRQGLAHNGKKCQQKNHLNTLFALFYGWEWDEMSNIANISSKLTKNANFRQYLAVFGLKVLILLGGSKSWGTHVTENPYRYLVRTVCLVTPGPNRSKMPICDQKD